MSIADWFKPTASWREKATALAQQLATVEAERERLEAEASAPFLAGTEDKGRADRDQRLLDLAARSRDLQRALATAESRAAADEAAAEAARQRRARPPISTRSR